MILEYSVDCELFIFDNNLVLRFPMDLSGLTRPKMKEDLDWWNVMKLIEVKNFYSKVFNPNSPGGGGKIDTTFFANQFTQKIFKQTHPQTPM